jgi:hypothetical protein
MKGCGRTDDPHQRINDLDLEVAQLKHNLYAALEARTFLLKQLEQVRQELLVGHWCWTVP